MSEIGVQFDEPRALELFRGGGSGRSRATSSSSIPEFVLEQVAKAPARVRVHARNPEHDVHIGGDRMMFLPAQGPPFVRIGDERRDGTLADLVNFIKLAQMQPELDTPGGNICEPDDVPLDSRHLVQTLALIVHSDKIFKGMPMSRTASEDTIRMGEILFGGREAIEQRPMMFANVNVNSPLRYDVRMLEAMLAYSAAGQPVIVTPFLLMGAMAPVSIPSALAQQMAEVLTGIALVQLIRPGGSVRHGLLPLGHRHAVGVAQLRRARVGLRALRVGPDRSPLRPALARRRRHADREPERRRPGRLRIAQHAAGGVHGGRQRRLPVGGLARERARDLLREVRRSTSSCCSSCAGSSRPSRSTRTRSPSRRTPRSGRAATSWAPSTRSSASASASGGRSSRRPRTSSAGGRTARTTPASAPASLWRAALERYEQPPLDDAVRAELSEFVERRTRELGDDPFPLPGAAQTV